MYDVARKHQHTPMATYLSGHQGRKQSSSTIEANSDMKHMQLGEMHRDAKGS